MKFIAIMECPQGQRPGEVFEATEDAGNVLVSIGAAKVYAEPTPDPLPTADEPTRTRRGYRRTDLRAED